MSRIAIVIGVIVAIDILVFMLLNQKPEHKRVIYKVHNVTTVNATRVEYKTCSSSNPNAIDFGALLEDDLLPQDPAAFVYDPEYAGKGIFEDVYQIKHF